MRSYEGKAREATPLHFDTQSPKLLAVKVQEFDILTDVIPSNTLKNKASNAGAFLNKPGAIMQAPFKNPRVRTVKSRHSKVP